MRQWKQFISTFWNHFHLIREPVFTPRTVQECSKISPAIRGWESVHKMASKISPINFDSRAVHYFWHFSFSNGKWFPTVLAMIKTQTTTKATNVPLKTVLSSGRSKGEPLPSPPPPSPWPNFFSISCGFFLENFVKMRPCCLLEITNWLSVPIPI